jgi:hypothetical protein
LKDAQKFLTYIVRIEQAQLPYTILGRSADNRGSGEKFNFFHLQEQISPIFRQLRVI